MYPSGVWRGFWEQTHFGRQPMSDFEMHFRNGLVRGHGRDVVGPFTVEGEYDPATGRVAFEKQYLGKHKVSYLGKPDGEGTIHGTWRIEAGYAEYTGPFALGPVFDRAKGDEPIAEIVK